MSSALGTNGTAILNGASATLPPPEVALCSLDDLPIGLGRAFRVGDRRVAVFRSRSGKVFATDNVCPHKAGPLAEGMLAGETVVCPLHAFRFNAHDGTCDQANVCAVVTYPVEVRDGRVYLALPTS
jgi:nitrite reductase (NADH) small subunit